MLEPELKDLITCQAVRTEPTSLWNRRAANLSHRYDLAGYAIRCCSRCSFHPLRLSRLLEPWARVILRKIVPYRCLVDDQNSRVLKMENPTLRVAWQVVILQVWKALKTR
jgi:hypothetical protein